MFDCLEYDSSEDDNAVVSKPSQPKASVSATSTITSTNAAVKAEEFPALPSSKKTTTMTGAECGMSYATMAAKTQDDYLNEQIMLNLAKKRTMPAVVAKPVETTVFKKNWADYSDDESDDEPEYVMPKASELDWAQDYDSDW